MVTLGIQFSNLSLCFNKKTSKIHLVSSQSIIKLWFEKHCPQEEDQFLK